jgi:hypothetical protein
MNRLLFIFNLLGRSGVLSSGRKSRSGIMGRFSWMVMGILLGAGLAYGASTNYVVRTNQGFELVPKTSVSFNEPYVDARTFSPYDWSQHSQLSTDIIKAGKQHIFTQSLIPTSQPTNNNLPLQLNSEFK